MECQGHSDTGSSRFPGRTVYLGKRLQMRTKLPVLDLKLTTNFRLQDSGLQEIIIVNMKKWMRKDTQDKKKFCQWQDPT